MQTALSSGGGILLLVLMIAVSGLIIGALARSLSTAGQYCWWTTAPARLAKPYRRIRSGAPARSGCWARGRPKIDLLQRVHR